jgi:hypothetical protein
MEEIMERTLLLLVVLSTMQGYAAFERTPHGSRSAAMGGSLVALGNNEWAAFTNPAALRTLNSPTLSLSYAPQIFGVKELSHVATSIASPTPVGTFALSASRFGFELYKETRVALSFAEEVTGTLRGGVTINYNSLTIQNYGSASTFGVDVGLLVDVVDDVRWGFAAMNLNAPTIGVPKEKLPQVFVTGIEYEPVSNARIHASVSKEIRFPIELHAGAEYKIEEIVALRAGTTSDPSTLNAGVGIEYAFAKIDYAFSSHPELGVTHQFSLSLNVGAFKCDG